ncbi:MAG: class I SAM-dependent methyltransferase [Anaerolineae bacterium]|nr:class I SAM-dependent methyltransferase [Anaerolineae bacterium]
MSAFYETVARFYDAETSSRTDDLALYSRLAQQYGGPILDVGCGTGRVLLHLAKEGREVYGVDDSREMLARLSARLKATPRLKKHIHITEADVLAYAPPVTFKLVLLTYNALMHFHTQEQQIALLQHLHRLTAPDGRLILDLPNAGEMFATQDTDSLILDRTFIDFETGNLIMLHSVSYLDRTTQLMRVQWIYDEVHEDGTVKRLFAPHVLRYFFYAELRLLLQVCGFAVTDVFGGTDEEPYVDGCERMVVYARPLAQ